MRFYLDGNDWEADYFIASAEETAWRGNNRNINNMLLDSAFSAGFYCPGSNYRPSFRGSVPGCDRTMLTENGVIDDPYYGRNMDHSRWSERFSWAFRKRFTLPEDMRDWKRIRLVFKGIDYHAHFFLNGVPLGTHLGMFIPAEFDVSSLLDRSGENLLAVIFEPVPQASPNHRMPDEYPQPAEFAEYHRSQMSYGWDWMRGMVAAGLWDSVYLSGSNRVRIRDCFFRSEGSRVRLEIDLETTEAVAAPLHIRLSPVNFAGASTSHVEQLQLPFGSCRITTEFESADVRRWYPAGYGEQPLYCLELEIDGVTEKLQVAFRSIAMQRNPDSPEGAYNQTFLINGKAVFARGLNWVPADLMHCRSQEKEYDRLVRLAAEAGFNLFRVWGGGIVEKDAFYAACDRYGIMVWQEFMHACSSYRKDPEYLAFKKREGEAILRKIRNHVSLSLICGGNEVDYYGETPGSPLYQQYRQLVETLTPDLDFHTSSPDQSRPGECHHGPWNFIDHSVINAHHRLVASEVGCNGLPEEESLRRFIPDKDSFPHGPSWSYHFLAMSGKLDMKKQFCLFNAGTVWEHSQASMQLQGDTLSYMMSHYRRKFPESSGCFIWQYNEPWPTCSVSIVDYYTLPKMAYYRCARANAPLTLSLRDDSLCCAGNTFQASLWVVNDGDAAELTVKFDLIDPAGHEYARVRETRNFATRTTKVTNIQAAWTKPPAGGLLLARLQLCGPEGHTLFEDERLYGAPDFKSAFELPETELTISAEFTPAPDRESCGLIRLHNPGTTAALNVRLDFPDLPHGEVYWLDNYVSLAPGTTRTVKVKLTSEAGRPETVRIRGWNVAARCVPVLRKKSRRRIRAIQPADFEVKIKISH